MDKSQFNFSGIGSFVKEFQAKQEKKRQAVLKKFFPEHHEHSVKVLDQVYFDAMFVAEKWECSCGDEFSMTREMLEDC
jgi:hypothetical protein